MIEIYPNMVDAKSYIRKVTINSKQKIMNEKGSLT